MRTWNIDELRVLLDIVSDLTLDDFNDEELEHFINFLLLDEYEIDSELDNAE